MYKTLLQKNSGTLQFRLGGFVVDLCNTQEELDYVETVQNRYGSNSLGCTLEEVEKALTIHRLEED